MGSCDVFTALWLAPVVLIILPKKSYQWDVPGSFFLALSFPVILGVAGWTGSGIYVSQGAFLVSAGILVALTISTILSPLPQVAMKQLILFWAAVFLGLSLAGNDVSILVVGISLVHAFFTIFHVLKSRVRWTGLSGNTNFAGVVLIPGIFLSYSQGPWFCLVSLVLVYALIKTRCRGAFLGVMVGFLFVQPIVAGFSGLLVVGYLLKKERGKPWGSMVIRWWLWRSAVRSLTVKTFLVGMGGDCGRVVFMFSKDPANRLRRIHSDIVQGLYDGGIFYVLAYLWIGISSVIAAMAMGEPHLAGAVAGLMVAGLFTDVRLLHTPAVLFWVLIGMINVAPDPVVVFSPWWLPVAVVLFVLVAQTWGRAFVADTVYGVAFRKDDLRLMSIAHQINPYNSTILCGVVNALVQTGRFPEAAFSKAMQLAQNFDGDVPVETVSFLLSVAAFNVGALKIAKDEAEKVLQFNGKHEGAIQLLSVIEKQMGE